MKKILLSIIALAFVINLGFSQGIDVGVTAMISPTPGSDMAMDFNGTMSFNLENFGPNIPNGDTLYLGMYFDGVIAPVGYTLELTSAFNTNDVILTSGPVDFSLLSNVTAGLKSICFRTAMITDTDLTNDSACAFYNILSGNGIASVLGEQSTIFLANGRLKIDVTNADIVGSSMLSVYNMAGTLIHSEEINGDGHIESTIDLTNESHGVYIFRLLSDGKLIESRKVMK